MMSQREMDPTSSNAVGSGAERSPSFCSIHEPITESALWAFPSAKLVAKAGGSAFASSVPEGVDGVEGVSKPLVNVPTTASLSTMIFSSMSDILSTDINVQYVLDTKRSRRPFKRGGGCHKS